ncbi:hypothetical protein K4749_34385 [Streptomyces sp. TRM72054]|uniref:hypothetical protein n=1 Tax=Streptomyces sp. TRM72054 TaxID=2870562 RepID=UPI001C8BB6C0|nr:hypothetical protein [Streptomyces sp. TRM72054]MBX9398535.1 hypothetical protein [Streptomyces sp. TRM72054]
MSFAAVGIIFFAFGILFAFNVGGAAERAFQIFARANPVVGTATPKTLRIVGSFWIPFGAFFIIVGFFR